MSCSLNREQNTWKDFVNGYKLFCSSKNSYILPDKLLKIYGRIITKWDHVTSASRLTTKLMLHEEDVYYLLILLKCQVIRFPLRSINHFLYWLSYYLKYSYLKLEYSTFFCAYIVMLDHLFYAFWCFFTILMKPLLKLTICHIYHLHIMSLSWRIDWQTQCEIKTLVKQCSSIYTNLDAFKHTRGAKSRKSSVPVSNSSNGMMT